MLQKLSIIYIAWIYKFRLKHPNPLVSKKSKGLVVQYIHANLFIKLGCVTKMTLN